MLRTGMDIIEVYRVDEAILSHGERFLERVYTESELVEANGRTSSLAARFAAKEAVMKALGTGIRGVGWRDIEVTRKRGGAPQITLHNRGSARAARMGMTQIAISISHSREYAVVSAVMSVDEDSHH